MMVANNKLIDMVGFRSGKLLVLARGTNAAGGRAQWVCLCDCGREFETRAASLRSGGSKSCGCTHAPRIRAMRLSHGHAQGHSETRIYKVWRAMRRRCNDRNSKNYKNYGGRGISICDRWQDFSNFLADMGKAPPGLTLDRINNDGNYEPGNCRWATWDQQANNKRKPEKPLPTHCRRGHEYSEGNTAWSKSRGSQYRVCRTCERENHRASRSRVLEAA